MILLKLITMVKMLCFTNYIYFSLSLVLVLTFLTFKIAKFLSNYFGKSGLRIMQRIMGLILMVISIEFIIKVFMIH